jgi:hypothetical protein
MLWQVGMTRGTIGSAGRKATGKSTTHDDLIAAGEVLV